ncbi:anhydro-N-acetylmuramic acid kinase [Idiomarina xiamenensis]|uniref:Anhydro-N-acetylmuramic acid kinase n=1 Tax=Idiomarina xiamenensis 10-D-4 TaxID=740709 RepID=K2KY19_9GAMM|nr:anhydro-N-acetylmuramic acid kinase [Idiomarina xiamenensis]EKE87469.1 anhydro-N-acetylmuramic acid kinase [Idiomarina xiamenensis 10-D-4]
MSDADYYIGLMSGTSMDGLDIVLVQFHGQQPTLIASHCQPIPRPLRQQLEQLCQPQHNDLHAYAVADRQFAMFCAEAVLQLLQRVELPATAITAIGSHGQTVRHQPQQQPSYTLQLGDAATLAALTGIDVIADFRRKDIALGGEGAPLVPAFHQAIFANPNEPRAVLNLGGIANLTYLPGAADQVTGFDSGPANTLLDQWFRHVHSSHDEQRWFDEQGQFAAQGQLLPALLETLLADTYFQRRPPKSTGRDDFNLHWLRRRCPEVEQYHPADVQQTLLQLTARSVAQACQQFLPTPPSHLYVCGGGALNPLLMEAIQQALGEQTQLHSTAALGVEPDWVEAMAFAWLARCYYQHQSGNLPAVTGASRAAILGARWPSA